MSYQRAIAAGFRAVNAQLAALRLLATAAVPKEPAPQQQALPFAAEPPRPPPAAAKRKIIDQSQDSTTRFYLALKGGKVGDVRLMPCLSEDMYEVYSTWAGRSGHRPAPLPSLVNTLSVKHGLRSRRMRYIAAGVAKGPHGVLIPPSAAAPEGTSERMWLGGCIATFRETAKRYRAK